MAFVFGIAVFGEQVRGGGWLALAVLGAVLIAAATVALARSPLLEGSSGQSEEGQSEETRAGPRSTQPGTLAGRSAPGS